MALKSLTLFLLSIAAFTPRAHGEALRNCTVNDTAAICRLGSVLHALYVVAIVLAVVLVLVLLLAVRLYRRNKADRSAVL